MEGRAGSWYRLDALEFGLHHTSSRKSTSVHAFALCNQNTPSVAPRSRTDFSVKISLVTLKNGSFAKDLTRQSGLRLPQQARLQRTGVSSSTNFADGALTSGPAVTSDFDNSGAADGLSELLFVGSGTSEGIPRVSCLTDPAATCPVSKIGIMPSAISSASFRV